MFNILQFHLEGRRVLDLYAGTGQLGAEALSRGARECVFVEQSGAAADVIRENTRFFEKRAVVIVAEALRWLTGTEERFDVVLLDPPYGSKLAQKTLELVFSGNMLTKGGLLLCECRPDAWTPEPQPPYALRRTYEYGNKRLLLYENRNLSGQL
jgi:16S rRNA (guanine(966)-N(2))-methyltransferase RsmD